jgi:hypothetical protein
MNLKEAEMGLKLNDPSRTNDTARLNHYWKSKGFREGYAQGVEEERKRAEILVSGLVNIKENCSGDAIVYARLALETYKSQREKK